MGYKLAFLGTVAVLIQSISGQCIGNPLNAGPRFNNGLSYGAYTPGNFGPNLAKPQASAAASTGGSFAVTSTSPVSPTGVSVLAENLAIEGPLNVGGNLPFLGTVGIEGAMPGAGAGSVSYGCGSGSVGIVSETGPGPYGLAGSIGGAYGAPIGSAPGANSPISPALGPYGIGSSGSFGARSPGAGPVGSFGLAGSPINSGFGYSGFGLRK